MPILLKLGNDVKNGYIRSNQESFDITTAKYQESIENMLQIRS